MYHKLQLQLLLLGCIQGSENYWKSKNLASSAFTWGACETPTAVWFVSYWETNCPGSLQNELSVVPVDREWVRWSSGRGRAVQGSVTRKWRLRSGPGSLAADVPLPQNCCLGLLLPASPCALNPWLSSFPCHPVFHKWLVSCHLWLEAFPRPFGFLFLSLDPLFFYFYILPGKSHCLSSLNHQLYVVGSPFPLQLYTSYREKLRNLGVRQGWGEIPALFEPPTRSPEASSTISSLKQGE